MKVANQFYSRLEDDSIELIRKPFNQTRKIFLFWCSTTRISHLQKKAACIVETVYDVIFGYPTVEMEWLQLEGWLFNFQD